MHIALLTFDFKAGGLARFALSLASGFISQGHDVDIVVLAANGEHYQELPPSVRVIELDSWLLRRQWVRKRFDRRSWSSIPAVAKYLRRSRPDVSTLR